MKNIGGTSQYIAFFDECGDHSLTEIDRDFPIFLLAAVIVERKAYVEQVVPSFASLKLRFWNHEGVNLHSREIRKSLGSFSFMMIAERRQAFLNELNELMTRLPFSLFVAGILKDRHVSRYGEAADNPYELALEFAMERIVHFLEGAGEHELPCIVEGRGKKEDEQLERVFYRIMTNGTYYRSRDQFRSLNCPLVFRSKRDNIAGIQLADLCAHPCARHILKPEQTNRAYGVAQMHLYDRCGVRGWIVFPTNKQIGTSVARDAHRPSFPSP